MNHFLHHTNLNIPEVNHKTVGPSWSAQSFAYPHNRIYYVTGGEAKIILKDRCLILREGYMYLLPAFMMVETICVHSFSHYFVHFHIDSLDFMTYLTFSLSSFYVPCTSPQKTTLLFEDLLEHYNHGDISSQLSTQGALQLLLAPFFDNLTIENDQINRFKPVLEYIDHHINQTIELDELAHLIELNTIYFSNIFSKTFQISPRQYINSRRLNLAQVLLSTSNKKIKKIALEVGFENEMYFSRLFKSKIGMTPGTYRRSVQV